MTKQLNIQHTDYHSENTSENQSKKRPEFLAADKEDKGQTNSSSTNNIRRQTPKENIKRTDIRGIYLNRNAIKSDAIDDYIDLVQSTDLNAFVMDVKDDNGKLTYDSNVPIAEEIKADGNPSVDDMKALLDRLEKEGIYTIARIVVFKDPFLAEQKEEFAIKRKNGGVWQDEQGIKWIDPYKKDVWDYMVSISEEVASYGFDEIQYDYIRFPANAKTADQNITFDNQENMAKDENVLSFLQYANKRLEDYSVQVSADVFGLVTTAKDDMGIGQLWERIAPNVDFISPMTYPSHYGPGSYGIENPDDHPYDIMKQAIQDAKRRNEKLEEKGINTAFIRPWIQDFDFGRKYEKRDIQNQIKALEELGIRQYLVWNARSKYTKNAYE
ncbi:putative glycoside hydrolase [Lentibacillus juripiscarius]